MCQPRRPLDPDLLDKPFAPAASGLGKSTLAQRPDSVSSFVNVRVAEKTAVHAERSVRGADFLTPPQDRDREIHRWLRDPDGHLIEAGQTSPPS